MSDKITAAMVANYLLTEVTPDMPVIFSDIDTDDIPDGAAEHISLERVLNDIAMEPERYQEAL